jgi:ribosomal protein S3
MESLINRLKKIYLLIKRYNNNNKYKVVYDKVYKNLILIYTNQYERLGISDLYVYFDKERLNINIVLSRASCFIGESGFYYYKYKKYMELDLGVEVQINLIEDIRFE